MTAIYKPTTDASGQYHARSDGNEAQSIRASQCGNLADVTANNTFIVAQPIYTQLPLVTPYVQPLPLAPHKKKTPD